MDSGEIEKKQKTSGGTEKEESVTPTGRGGGWAKRNTSGGGHERRALDDRGKTGTRRGGQLLGDAGGGEKWESGAVGSCILRDYEAGGRGHLRKTGATGSAKKKR